MTGRDRTAAVAGLLAVAAFVAGQYVAPALVWPEEQVGGVQRSFYASFEGRLLAQAVLFGLGAALVVGALAVASVAGLDADAAGQVVFLLVSAWVAALAWSVGWALPSAAGRTASAPGRPG